MSFEVSSLNVLNLLTFYAKCVKFSQIFKKRPMDLNLQGKNALVGGSSKGIGKAIAFELAALGANVTLVSRSPDKMADIAEQLDHSRGQHHDFLIADYSNIEDVQKKIHGLVSGKIIHILVHNTGGPAGGPALDAELSEFEQAFNNHLLCGQVLVQSVVPGMKQAEFGRIINIISTSVKSPIPGLGVSNTIRGAVANWSKTLATELAPFGITVNNVLPGMTSTERLQEIIENRAEKAGSTPNEVAEQMKTTIPMQRFAAAPEIAAAAAFLASPAASYITGTNVTVDGGRTKSL